MPERIENPPPLYAQVLNKITPATPESLMGQAWRGWCEWVANSITSLFESVAALNSGLSITITTAPLTGGGAAGSMTFENGRLVDSTPAT